VIVLYRVFFILPVEGVLEGAILSLWRSSGIFADLFPTTADFFFKKKEENKKTISEAVFWHLCRSFSNDSRFLL
jgi:hypothetical protein